MPVSTECAAALLSFRYPSLWKYSTCRQWKWYSGQKLVCPSCMHVISTCVSKSLLEFGISLCSETVVG